MTAAVLAALCIALLVGAELSCRRWFRRRSRYYVWPPHTRIEVRLDPEIFAGFPLRPRFDINADGERGGDLPGHRDGVFRVLVAGGSAAECLALDQGTSWPGVLERVLNSPKTLQTLGARVAHVGNISRSGIACRHLDVIFERVLPQYGRLSAIVIMAGAADVAHWLEEGAPQVETDAPVLISSVFSCHPGERFGWKPRQWAAVELGRRLRRKWLRPVEVREGAGSWIREARRMRAQSKEVRVEVPTPTVMLDRFIRCFTSVLERAKRHADRVLVVRQPWFEGPYSAEEMARFWHGGVGRVWKDNIEVFYSLDVVDRLMNMVDARAAATAEELGVEQLALRSVLPQTIETFYDHLHFTPRGSEAVGRAIAAALAGARVGALRSKTVRKASATPSISSGLSS